MPEPTEPTERLGEKAQKRISQLELVVKELCKAMQILEKSTGEALMPEGEFYGIKFED